MYMCVHLETFIFWLIVIDRFSASAGPAQEPNRALQQASKQINKQTIKQPSVPCASATSYARLLVLTSSVRVLRNLINKQPLDAWKSWRTHLCSNIQPIGRHYTKPGHIEKDEVTISFSWNLTHINIVIYANKQTKWTDHEMGCSPCYSKTCNSEWWKRPIYIYIYMGESIFACVT